MEKFNTATFATRRFLQLLALVAVIALAACSTIRLSYEHGDTLLYWWLDAYVDFDPKQKTTVKRDIDALLDWHRRTQLKEYVEVLGTIQRQLDGNLSVAQVQSDYQTIRQRTQLLVTKALPELADLARSMRPEQLRTMEKKFAANNDEFRKKMLSGDPDKRQKQRYLKLLDQFETLYGSFSSEQEKQIRKWSDARPLDNELWFEARLRRQRQILALLRRLQTEHPGREATMALLQAEVSDLFEHPETPERQAFFDASTNSTMELIVKVTQLTTPAQKAHARKRLQGWIDDLNALAAARRS